jgi:hypothetical protein
MKKMLTHDLVSDKAELRLNVVVGAGRRVGRGRAGVDLMKSV